MSDDLRTKILQFDYQIPPPVRSVMYDLLDRIESLETVQSTILLSRIKVLEASAHSHTPAESWLQREGRRVQEGGKGKPVPYDMAPEGHEIRDDEYGVYGNICHYARENVRTQVPFDERPTVVALRTRVKELEADRERLDWMDAIGPFNLFKSSLPCSPYNPVHFTLLLGTEPVYGQTIREAIDAARKEKTADV